MAAKFTVTQPLFFLLFWLLRCVYEAFNATTMFRAIVIPSIRQIIAVNSIKLPSHSTIHLLRPQAKLAVPIARHVSIFANHQSLVQPREALVVKKRKSRKKRPQTQAKEGKFNVAAFATANEYDLDELHTALVRSDRYGTRKFYTDPDQEVLHVQLKDAEETAVNSEPQEIFFFREGSVVLWNCSDAETDFIVQYLKNFEINPYELSTIEEEKEVMDYAYTEHNNGGDLKNEIFWLRSNEPSDLFKYTYSNAMTSSVKLGVWERMLNEYSDGLAEVTSDLKNGKTIRMTRADILKRTGELFELKHLVNLNSELLGTPDFYWEHESLERLFAKTCHYFSISKRKRVS